MSTVTRVGHTQPGLAPEGVVDVVDELSPGPGLCPGHHPRHVHPVPLHTPGLGPALGPTLGPTLGPALGVPGEGEEGREPVHGVHQVAGHAAAMLLLNPATQLTAVFISSTISS